MNQNEANRNWDQFLKEQLSRIEKMMEEEQRELVRLQDATLNASRDTTSVNVLQALDKKRTFGEVVADKIADFGGSWTFILIFVSVMMIWMTFNVVSTKELQFDAYPFILLNLVLSCLAALQAPIIMMSQNRQEEKDRAQSENDYVVNLKAELEVRELHIKIDQLLRNQWGRMMEVQRYQVDLLTEVLKRHTTMNKEAAQIDVIPIRESQKK